MLRSVVVGQYYKDLRNEKYTTAFAVYHRRFSTNTNPRWPLAQPMRTLGHNGEIPCSTPSCNAYSYTITLDWSQIVPCNKSLAENYSTVTGHCLCYPLWSLEQPCSEGVQEWSSPLESENVRTCGAGEINTLQGNLNWVASREHSLSNPVWEGRESELLPLCNAAESDSANLDHVAELLMRTGVASEEALMILVPEAYDNHPDLQKAYPEVRPYCCFCSPEENILAVWVCQSCCLSQRCGLLC